MKTAYTTDPAVAEKMLKRAKICLLILWISFFGLLVMLTLNTWVFTPEGKVPSITIYLLLVGPLLLFVPGLITLSLSGIAWFCFINLWYFSVAVVDSMSPYASWNNYLELCFTVTSFTCAMLFIRFKAASVLQPVKPAPEIENV
jgi:uncharacterized membrane protein